MAKPPTRLTAARSGRSGSAVAAMVTQRATESGSARSASTSTRPSRGGSRSSSLGLNQGTTTRQPASSSVVVTPVPRPPVPPVTSAVRPFAGSVIEPGDRLGDAARLREALALDGHLGDDLHAALHGLHRRQPHP